MTSPRRRRNSQEERDLLYGGGIDFPFINLPRKTVAELERCARTDNGTRLDHKRIPLASLVHGLRGDRARHPKTVRFVASEDEHDDGCAGQACHLFKGNAHSGCRVGFDKIVLDTTSDLGVTRGTWPMFFPLDPHARDEVKGHNGGNHEEKNNSFIMSFLPSFRLILCVGPNEECPRLEGPRDVQRPGLRPSTAIVAVVVFEEMTKFELRNDCREITGNAGPLSSHLHRALQILEIVQMICEEIAPEKDVGQSDWSHVATLARACTFFLHPPLDVLWRSQGTITNLLRCIPDDLCEMNEYLCQDPKSYVHDLTRFPLSMIVIDHLQVLSRSITAADWQRPLFYMTGIASRHSHAAYFPIFKSFSSTLPLRDSALHSTVSEFSYPAYRQTFDLRLHVQMMLCTSAFVCGLKHIESLDVPGLDDMALAHLARVPILTSLGTGLLQPLNPSIWRANDSLFPALSATKQGPLPSLLLHGTVLKMPIGFELDDPMISDIACAWPRIEQLHLVANSHRHARSKVTLKGVYSFTARCPELEDWALTFDATVFPQLAINAQQRVSQRVLHHFKIGLSPINDARSVSKFLFTVFPALKKRGIMPGELGAFNDEAFSSTSSGTPWKSGLSSAKTGCDHTRGFKSSSY
ncbi:hypothetical protein K438DRAFT_1756825 [Mycena galopus ATCC 62051]|nr:hypothetical protein K438DRAFT_1756825 [Mycena galopus ATCC 62051]